MSADGRLCFPVLSHLLLYQKMVTAWFALLYFLSYNSSPFSFLYDFNSNCYLLDDLSYLLFEKEKKEEKKMYVYEGNLLYYFFILFFFFYLLAHWWRVGNLELFTEIAFQNLSGVVFCFFYFYVIFCTPLFGYCFPEKKGGPKSSKSIDTCVYGCIHFFFFFV